MELTERKKKILRAIVENYIQTAEPVGSKVLSAMPGMDCSSATIRNEMADLTQMGLLEQPHTSAGRIPSPAGYRLYVDELMQDYRLSVDETQSLNQAMELKLQEVDKVISQVSKMVSKMTNLPAMAMTAAANAPTVKRFDLIMAGEGSFILVIMTSGDVVKNRLIKLPLTCTEQDLKLLAAVLNASCTDLTPDSFTPELLERVSRSAGPAGALVPLVLDYATHVLSQQAKSEVYVSGQMKLLGQPEYRDIDKAQEVLSSLDGETLSNLPATMADIAGTQILVGPENIAKELKDTSVVMTRFDIGDGMQGLIGVVGPTRMDYAQVTARLSYFAENLGRMFAKPELPPSQGEE
ncbi:MAG: heat-inducible transcription repressor HrcA [Oscillospiraceae bacterium]|nr:heat-inducible transcription repressor HrcA [Oscillospiraceae bacterium]